MSRTVDMPAPVYTIACCALANALANVVHFCSSISSGSSFSTNLSVLIFFVKIRFWTNFKIDLSDYYVSISYVLPYFVTICKHIADHYYVFNLISHQTKGRTYLCTITHGLKYPSLNSNN